MNMGLEMRAVTLAAAGHGSPKVRVRIPRNGATLRGGTILPNRSLESFRRTVPCSWDAWAEVDP